MSQETSLLQTKLKDIELRELQLFLSQSPLTKFASESISKDLLLKLDDSFLKLICEQF